MNFIEELYKSARSKKLKVQRGTEEGRDCQAKMCRLFLFPGEGTISDLSSYVFVQFVPGK